ncbi:hypothetical protein T492DRAFT_842919 [Pavlovales sp. CCMP2436]|nr:hypothetical protein T492DRAFT_842919 [Pavlovales sp. CCMP2436]
MPGDYSALFELARSVATDDDFVMMDVARAMRSAPTEVDAYDLVVQSMDTAQVAVLDRAMPWLSAPPRKPEQHCDCEDADVRHSGDDLVCLYCGVIKKYLILGDKVHQRVVVLLDTRRDCGTARVVLGQDVGHDPVILVILGHIAVRLAAAQQDLHLDERVLKLSGELAVGARRLFRKVKVDDAPRHLALVVLPVRNHIRHEHKRSDPLRGQTAAVLDVNLDALAVDDFVKVGLREVGHELLVDIGRNDHAGFDQGLKGEILLSEHKTKGHIGPRQVRLDDEQSKRVLVSLDANKKAGKFRKFYCETEEGMPVMNMTARINITACKSGDGQMDVRLYGCNTYRRNIADLLVLPELEQALITFARASKIILDEAVRIQATALNMGTSAGVIITEYRKSDKVKWTIESKAAVQFMSHAAARHGQQKGLAVLVYAAMIPRAMHMHVSVHSPGPDVNRPAEVVADECTDVAATAAVLLHRRAHKPHRWPSRRSSNVHIKLNFHVSVRVRANKHLNRLVIVHERKGLQIRHLPGHETGA